MGKRARLALSFKLLFVTELLVLVAIAAMLIPVREQMRGQVVDDLRREISGIAATAVLQLNPADVRQIRHAGDERLPAFARIRDQLLMVRAVNQLTEEQIYTVHHDPADDTYRFGIMTQTQPFTGNLVESRPELAACLNDAVITTTGLYDDAHGQWISAFAPIVDATGNVVAALEVNRKSDAYFERYRRVQWVTASIAVATLGLASMLGWLVTNRVVLRPMRAVSSGMAALSRKEFTHRVNLRTRDEFQDLGELLNSVAYQLDAARSVASGFVPTSLPRPDGWRIAALTEPCDATAGDYFDAFEIPAHGDIPSPGVAVLVADVTGHGLGPSLHMAACRSALRALAHQGLEPADLIARLDILMSEDLNDGRFITMIFGILAPDGSFTYCNAGHGPTLAVLSGVTTTLQPHRPPIGVGWFTPHPDEHAQTTLHLSPGDRVVLASDGVSEVTSPAGHHLGEPAIADAATRPGASAADVVEDLRKRVLTHCGGRSRTDDVTILCFERVA